MVNLYNAFNNDYANSINTTFSTTASSQFLRPTAVLLSRMFKIGGADRLLKSKSRTTQKPRNPQRKVFRVFLRALLEPVRHYSDGSWSGAPNQQLARALFAEGVDRERQGNQTNVEPEILAGDVCAIQKE